MLGHVNECSHINVTISAGGSCSFSINNLSTTASTTINPTPGGPALEEAVTLARADVTTATPGGTEFDDFKTPTPGGPEQNDENDELGESQEDEHSLEIESESDLEGVVCSRPAVVPVPVPSPDVVPACSTPPALVSPSVSRGFSTSPIPDEMIDMLFRNKPQQDREKFLHIQTYAQSQRNKQTQCAVLLNGAGTFWDLTKTKPINIQILRPLMHKLNQYQTNCIFNPAQIQYLCNIIMFQRQSNVNYSNIELNNISPEHQNNLWYNVTSTADNIMYPFNSSFFYNIKSKSTEIIHSNPIIINELTSKLTDLNQCGINLKQKLLKEAYIGNVLYNKLKIRHPNHLVIKFVSEIIIYLDSNYSLYSSNHNNKLFVPTPPPKPLSTEESESLTQQLKLIGGLRSHCKKKLNKSKTKKKPTNDSSAKQNKKKSGKKKTSSTKTKSSKKKKKSDNVAKDSYKGMYSLFTVL